MRWIARAVAPLVFGALSLSSALAEKRVALVIGNDTYPNLARSHQLVNARNDARAMAAAFRELGFAVIYAEDVGRSDFMRLWQDFLQTLELRDTAAFFFAGHGVDLSGVNYLIPNDVPNAGEEVLRRASIRFDDLRNDLHNRRLRVALIVLDASRNNPIRDSRGHAIGRGRGLTRIDAAVGSFVMSSAGIGEEALDRLSATDTHPNSLYIRTLLPILQTPDLGLSEIAERVGSRVQAAARAVGSDQTPAFYNRLAGDFILKPMQSPVAAAMAQPMAPRPSIERKSVAPRNDCDRLAAGPMDSMRVGEGVLFQNLDAARAVPACRKAVEAHPGEVRFQTRLGRALAKAENYKEARRWWADASEQDDADAMYSLGVLHANGYGVPPDYGAARSWYEKAAAKSHTLAMYNLGRLYDYGQGVARDFAAARVWYEKAAAKDYTPAMTDLGMIYHKGEGVPQDYVKAHGWYERAAAKGDAGAMNNLGLLYEHGHGVAQSSATAWTWYTKAAAKGEVAAMRNQALLFDKGRGVPVDSSAAARHLLAAASQGLDDAKQDLQSAMTTWREDTRRALQRLLKDAGIYQGQIDGVWNDASRDAAKLYWESGGKK